MNPFYDTLQKLYEKVIEGYTASSRGEFPPRCPYAPGGLVPGDENDQPEAAAWFFGYWAYAYKRHGELGNFKR